MNGGFEYREQIGPREAGRTVLDHLARRYRHSSATTWRQRIAAGEVTRDAAAAGPDDVLGAGQWLAWRRPPWNEEPVPHAWAMLHRDADLLAVAKPRGLPAVPAGGFLEHTLLHLVTRAHPEAAPLHRLGRGTSGVTVFSRAPGARRTLSAAWAAGGVEKTYRALVEGVPKAAFRVEAPIGPVPHPRLGSVHAATPGGKPAVSDVRLLEARDDRALVEVRIATGRPHQIRIHLAAAGHPLTGDPLYLAGGAVRDALPGEGGYWLHAACVRFAHPRTGAPLALECVPPPPLRTRA